MDAVENAYQRQNLDMQESIETDNCGRTCRTVIFTIKNVKPLCANCHRMIHRNPIKPITIEELKEIVEPSLIQGEGSVFNSLL